MVRRTPPHLWIKIVIPGAGAIGPGKIDLLRAIEDQHSISAAARELDMSYRRAWMLIDETRAALGAEVVETHTGGADRGGASLTEAGRQLIAIYDAVLAKAADAAASELGTLAGLGAPLLESPKGKRAAAPPKKKAPRRMRAAS